MFNLLNKCQALFHSSCSILHSHQQCMRVPVSSHPHQHLFPDYYYYDYYYYYYRHPTGCKVVSHCSFDLHFLNEEWCWIFFDWNVGHFCIFFGEIPDGKPLVSRFVVGTLSCTQWRSIHHGDIVIRFKFQRNQGDSTMEDNLWGIRLEKKGRSICNNPSNDSRKSEELNS